VKGVCAEETLPPRRGRDRVINCTITRDITAPRRSGSVEQMEIKKLSAKQGKNFTRGGGDEAGRYVKSRRGIRGTRMRRDILVYLLLQGLGRKSPTRACRKMVDCGTKLQGGSFI